MSNRTSNHLVVTLLSLAAAAAGCGPVAAEGVSDSLGTVEQAVTNLPNPCLTQAPDKTLLIPAYPAIADKTYSLTSGSGYYAYRTGCTYFIADVEMAQLSNCELDPSIGFYCGDYVGSGAPYDLPSSLWQSYGLGWPTTAEDCNHFTVDYRVYLMPAGSQTFTQLTWHIDNGSWNGTTCDRSIAKDVEPVTITQSASDTGVDTYRFLTRVKERSSYQETQAFIELAPPE